MIHVRDFHAHDSENQKKNVMAILNQLDVYPNSPSGPVMIEVLNKIDKVTISNRLNIINKKKKVHISAKTGQGIDLLKKTIEKLLISV